MNLRLIAVVASLLGLALSGCAQQQTSPPSAAPDSSIAKLRDQCVAGDTQACQKIARRACMDGTPETCRAECWPANVAQACAAYNPEKGNSSLPGPGGFGQQP